VCENNHQTPSIPQETYTKICYVIKSKAETKSAALAAYAKAAEKRAQQAALQSSQLDARNQQLTQQRSDASNTVDSALADFNRSMTQLRENAEQMNRSLTPSSPPMPSFGLGGGNRLLNCMSTGGITICH
jgi:predicted  nucleic acid-binding Zn-ribbon protein